MNEIVAVISVEKPCKRPELVPYCSSNEGFPQTDAGRLSRGCVSVGAPPPLPATSGQSLKTEAYQDDERTSFGASRFSTRGKKWNVVSGTAADLLGPPGQQVSEKHGESQT